MPFYLLQLLSSSHVPSRFLPDTHINLHPCFCNNPECEYILYWGSKMITGEIDCTCPWYISFKLTFFHFFVNGNNIICTLWNYVSSQCNLYIDTSINTILMWGKTACIAKKFLCSFYMKDYSLHYRTC